MSYIHKMECKGKVAIITGSTSGIGLAVAHDFARKGVNLIITGVASAEEVETILEDLRRHNVSAEFIGCDLGSVSEINTLCSSILQLYPQGVDILVNNAGFNFSYPLEDFPDELFDNMMSVMFAAPFYVTKRLLPTMKQKGWGRIVNTASQLAHVAIKGKTPYCAIKSGIIGFTKGVALEMAECGITCNAICPTFTRTAQMDKQIATKAKEKGITFEEYLQTEFADSVPTKKFATVEQVADLVAFLCFSEASSQITGAAYNIDGGYTIQ